MKKTELELAKDAWLPMSEKAIAHALACGVDYLKFKAFKKVRMKAHASREAGTWQVMRHDVFVPVGVWPKVTCNELRNILRDLTQNGLSPLTNTGTACYIEKKAKRIEREAAGVRKPRKPRKARKPKQQKGGSEC